MRKHTIYLMSAFIALALAIVSCSGSDKKLEGILERIPVLSVTLNADDQSKLITLDQGSQESLLHTILPEDAENKNVEWSSDNTSIATVNSNGLVTAVAIGAATIRVVTQDGGHQASCTVIVFNDAQATGTPDTSWYV